MKVDDAFLDEVKNNLTCFKYPFTLKAIKDEHGEYVNCEMKADHSFFANEEVLPSDTAKDVANAIWHGMAMNILSWTI